MIRAAMGGEAFRWPAGCYVHTDKYQNVMMAMETTIQADGRVKYADVKGTPEEIAELDASYKHLCALRDQVIEMEVIPAVSEWHTINPHLKK